MRERRDEKKLPGRPSGQGEDSLGKTSFCAETERQVQLPRDRRERLSFLTEKVANRMEQSGILGAMPSVEEIYDGESVCYRFLWDEYEYGIEIVE